jgi:hypothetical protein
MASTTNGSAASSSLRTAPSRSISADERKRSRRRSGKRSTPRQGFEPRGRSPQRSARPHIFDRSASMRLAWIGVARIPCGSPDRQRNSAACDPMLFCARYMPGRQVLWLD